MRDEQAFPPGSLAVVALPLGNSGDITLRAIEVLRAADLVAAEDTRTVGRLLGRLGIRAPLLSYHDWNEAERAQQLLGRLRGGQRIALAAEAGTPGISDPGFDLVRLARREGLPVFPVPGPCAVTTFLSSCGLPTDRFAFFGFPPTSRKRRLELFATLAGRPETLVFYESPRRILAALEDAVQVFGNRECALAREMTKPHEEFLLAPLPAVRQVLAERPRIRGEVCWGIHGARRRELGTMTVAEAVSRVLAAGLPPRQAAREAAQLSGAPAKECYAEILARKRSTLADSAGLD